MHESAASQPIETTTQDTKPILVELQNIHKSYQKNSFALQNLSLSFAQGDITGIVGANANGKSTLVKIIVGEHLQDAGTLRFPLWEGDKTTFSWQKIKQNIAYVPQELPIWHGSLRENIAYEATLHGIFGQKNTDAVEYILQRLGLLDYVDASWQELSGGYKLRYALARALVWHPQLLILDEPLANLDINAQLIVLSDLKAMAASIDYPVGVILTSQHIHEVELVADQIIVLDKGILKFAGKARAFENEARQHIFELHTSLTLHELTDKLRDLPVQQLEQKGAYFIVYLPNIFSVEQFLGHIAAQSIGLSYFRDISHSVKQLF